MEPILAVIIATRNRADALERYSLPSLVQSDFQDFICLIWDASEDDSTRVLAHDGRWTFPLEYRKAQRPGSASQRNDAVEHILRRYPSVRHILFIDDDCELLSGALEGVVRTFEDASVWGVGIPVRCSLKERNHSWGRTRRRYLTAYMKPVNIRPERHGEIVEWLIGCSMAFRAEAFRDLGLRFPEAFQRFGGYALSEDVALSYGLHRIEKKKLLLSLSGEVYHHTAPGGRLNLLALSAARWYNHHLIFELINHGEKGWRLALKRARTALYWFNRSMRYLFRGRFRDFAAYLRGIAEGQKALEEYRRTQDIRTLIKKV